MNAMKLTEKTISQKMLVEGRIINLRQDTVMLENGKTALRDVVEHPGGVCVLPLTEDNEVILVKQFRYPYQEVLFEIPAGKLDKGEEDPLHCGMRELEEEAGDQSDIINLSGKSKHFGSFGTFCANRCKPVGSFG